VPALSIAAATVIVPPVDHTPPDALLRLDERDGLSALAAGSDPDGGVARVRISVEEHIRCRDLLTGERSERIRIRYFPPPAIARIKVQPGTPLPAERSRRARLPIAGDPCPGSDVDRLEGTVRADVTNAHELEASSQSRLYNRRPLLQFLLDALPWILP
jgi:hypothetical protein